MAHILISEIIFFKIFSESEIKPQDNTDKVLSISKMYFWTRNLYNLTFQDFSNSENLQVLYAVTFHFALNVNEV